MLNNNCLYCTMNETLNELMIEICKMKVSTVFLFREQTYRGRCIVAYNKHDVELYDLEGQDLLAYMEDVNNVARAIKHAFAPIKVNYGAYADKLPHLHIHLVPKYADGPDFGGVFEMNPQRVYFSEDAYIQTINMIKSKLL